MRMLVPYLFSVIVFSSCSTSSDTIQKTSKLKYQEKYRPQFHFTPDSMWMNDPNGMVYYEGEYHLFYQYYPDSTVWGPMHWGHAVSGDLVTWEHLPIALYPDSLGLIFSGSAVIDYENTTGFGSKENPAMVAIFTHHLMEGEKSGNTDFQYQSLAYSLDKGRSWKKYEGNPVLANPGIKDFRDPKVMWYEASKRWIMTLAVKDRIHFYSSDNLKSWEFENEFGQDNGAHGGVWECPDLIQLTTEGGKSRWILLVSINPGGPQGGSATQYFVGDFDGASFVAEDTLTRWLDYGADNYAGVTWSNVPKSDGRTLFIGWMSNWDYARLVPTERWRSAMTIPRKLTLMESTSGFQVISEPIEELTTLRNSAYEIGSKSTELTSSNLEIILQSENSDQGKLHFINSYGDTLSLVISHEKVILDRSKAGQSGFHAGFADAHNVKSTSQYKIIQIFLDESSIEVFFNNGELVMTDLIFPNEPYATFIIEQGAYAGTIYTLETIWRD